MSNFYKYLHINYIIYILYILYYILYIIILYILHKVYILLDNFSVLFSERYLHNVYDIISDNFRLG